MHDDDEAAPGVWTWLQAWYAIRCDGDWEHEYGIRIESLDNPGWSLTIDVADTGLADQPYEQQEIHRSQHDWVITRVQNAQFHAACGPLNLGEALHLFRRWADADG
ncbi:immunity 53 family protein [Micromonospora chaiyaphumensis]|uniref:Immunity protein 53 n=1 Tax=Micromonospora chaiyaphumensis TaxID=307119 RepID=A0A1C4XIT0_9ACTN|nr:immunity 53 family protein [Micromonospora chaiyaphumensis]SCF08410.1 Immunity protein 53 [Micromonospora chaiyaphumensis]